MSPCQCGPALGRDVGPEVLQEPKDTPGLAPIPVHGVQSSQTPILPRLLMLGRGGGITPGQGVIAVIPWLLLQ